jgi:hypothetical protein
MLKLFIQDIGNDGIKDSIAQKFQAFIIHPSSFLRANRGGSMRHGFPVETYPVRVESQYVVKRKIRLFSFMRKSLDPFYESS